MVQPGSTAPIQRAESGSRVEQLDSLRGLAALSVVVSHHLLVFPAVFEAFKSTPPGPGEALLLLPPVYIFWAGHSAVVLFFVLSGYVLSLPVFDGRQPTYSQYVAKRVCRIYLPYLVAVMAALVGASTLSRGEIPELSSWFRSSWTVPVEPKHLADHALFLPDFDTERFNNVIWSLVHEMRLSLVFPPLALLVARQRWQSCLAVAGCLSLVGCLGPQLDVRFHWLTNYGLTVHYAAMFIVGAILAKHRRWIATKLAGMPPAAHLGLVGIGALLYVSECWHPAARMGSWIHQVEYLTAVGAAVLVGCAASAAWLRAAPLRWLGRVSYSLYLWHLPVLLAAVHLGYGRIPLWAILILSIVAGIVVAGVMYRLVEAPAAGLAKSIGSKRRPTEDIPAGSLRPEGVPV
ncbi:MAG: acyltransferase family protein [Gemmataceae bacterium]